MRMVRIPSFIMVNNRLYLIEVYVSDVTFRTDYGKFPRRREVTLNVRFGKIMNMEIHPEDFPVEEPIGPVKNIISMAVGKTFLFSIDPTELIDSMKSFPLELSLKVENKLQGSALVEWNSEFIDMVKASSDSVVRTTDFEGVIPMNKGDDIIGGVEICLHMTCFADGLETSYRKHKNGTFSFINKKTGSRYSCKSEAGSSGEPILCANIHGTMVNPMGGKKDLSWTDLFGGTAVCVRPSMGGPQFEEELKGGNLVEILAQSSAFDIVSMVFRPPENKFFDFMNMVSNANQPEDSRERGRINSELELPLTKSGEEDDRLMLTSEKIGKQLCKNKDCPAAVKFKEFGIGPLAKEKCLGTLYGEVEPPCTYGLSNTYGVMENYGPFGVYSRPKRTDQPFIPKDPPSEEAMPPMEPEVPAPPKKTCPGAPKPPCTPKLCCACYRQKCGGGMKGGSPHQEFGCRGILRGGGSSGVLRLRGGGSGEFAEPPLAESSRFIEPRTPLAESTRIALEPRSPFQECKSVMDQFDDILAAYKRALGPCGEATCPYAQSLAEENCKKICEQPPKDSESISCSEVPCSMVECPYQEPRKFDIPGGCGSIKCAYTKYKLGLVDDDAALELACLPPAISGKCGHPKCPYPLPPDLPPIHWDCPEPLPKGVCRNVNCPHQPADLRKIKCPPPKPGPCGKVTCPFAMPEPCDKPNCPFRARPCPFLEQEKQRKKQECGKEQNSSVELCENPDCPYFQQEDPMVDDPRYQGEFEACANPACPHAQPPKKKKETCGNPSCPFAEEEPKECGNPKCPFAPPPSKTNFCGNPQCPHSPKSKANGNTCGNPDCPHAPKPPEDDFCGNPDCAYAPKQEKSEDSFCGNPACPYNPQTENNSDEACDNPKCPAKKRNKEQESICENPECPYQISEQSKMRGDEKRSKKNSVCSNPECPENKKPSNGADAGDACDNPECPYGNNQGGGEFICRDPFCMYAQPLPSCGIPNCPFEPMPLLYCPSRKCPSNSPPPIQERAKSSVCYREDEPGEEQEKDGDEGTCDKDCANRRQSSSFAEGTATRRSSLKVKGDAGAAEGGDTEQSPINGKRKRRKKRGAFVYSVGDRYPGVKVGHKECVTPIFNVPPKMGWLWNVSTSYSQPRRGWRPGAIQKSIAQRIRAHRQAKGLGYFRPPKFRKSREGLGGSNDEILVQPKPTLHICKKDGAYLITMNPLKDPYSLVENENPYMDCTPMQFRITKNKKQEDGDDESKICTCVDEEKSSSSDSELDIEFTPPAGIIHPERFKKKKNVVHTDTQYNPGDFATTKEKGGKGGKGKDKKGKGGKGKKGKKK